jgi:Tfp pilus assembly protein PilF
LVDEAASVLLGAVRDGSYDPFTLSNLATCYVVRGDIKKAKALISAANYHSSKGHASAVLALNQAFPYLHLNDRVNAMESLEDALERSPNEIRRYLANSVLFNPYRSVPGFIALLRSA